MLRQLTHLTLDASADAGFALRITPDAAQTSSLGAIQHLDGADIRLGRPRRQQSHAGGIPDHPQVETLPEAISAAATVCSRCFRPGIAVTS